MTQKDKYLLKKIEDGFTVKKESHTCYRIFNKYHKYYFVLYTHDYEIGEVWSLGETSNYKLAQYDISMPIEIKY